MDRRFQLLTRGLVVLGVGISIGIGFVIYKVMAARTAVVEARPLVINSSPPELIQPFICDLRAGFQAGSIRTFLRNVGDSQAVHITQTFALRMVPERKVGIPSFDEIPSGNCKDKAQGVPMAGVLAITQINTTVLPQPVVTLPPLLSGESAQLYGVSCAYYEDDAGTRHSVCDTYRYRLADGSAAFTCDGSPRAGKFEASMMNCGN